MSRRNAGIAIGLLLILVVVVVVWVQRGDDAETVDVRRGDIDVTIETVGTLEPSGPSPVRARAGGTVELLGATPGDSVESGDILVQLDRTSFRREIRQARQALTDAEFALQLAERRAEENPDDQEQQFNLLEARSRVEQAREALNEAERALAYSAIRVAEDGIVLEMLVVPGDAVGETQPVARVYRKSGLQMIAEVDELDLPNVEPGTEARFRLDAFPAEEITGTVTRTAPEARQQGGATIFPTTIEFDPPEELDIRPGMNATVTIVTEARAGVLLIPDRAIRTVGERAFVTVRTPDGDDEEREIVLGYRGDQGQVEVVSGLSEGDTLVLPE